MSQKYDDQSEEKKDSKPKSFKLRWMKFKRQFCTLSRIRYLHSMGSAGWMYESLYLELLLLSLEYTPSDQVVYNGCDPIFTVCVDKSFGDFYRDLQFMLDCTSLNRDEVVSFLRVMSELRLLQYDADDYLLVLTPSADMVDVGHDAESKERTRRYRARNKAAAAALADNTPLTHKVYNTEDETTDTTDDAPHTPLSSGSGVYMDIEDADEDLPF